MSTAKASPPMRTRLVFRLLAALLVLIPATALAISVAHPLLAPPPHAPTAFAVPSLHDPAQSLAFPPSGAPGAFVVNVFASWCGSCLVEHPLLLDLKDRYALPIYGIAWRDDPKATQAWLTRHKNPYVAVGYDLKGDRTRSLGITGTPETLVLDPQGAILYRHRGPLTADVVKNMIAPALASR